MASQGSKSVASITPLARRQIRYDYVCKAEMANFGNRNLFWVWISKNIHLLNKIWHYITWSIMCKHGTFLKYLIKHVEITQNVHQTETRQMAKCYPISNRVPILITDWKLQTFWNIVHRHPDLFDQDNDWWRIVRQFACYILCGVVWFDMDWYGWGGMQSWSTGNTKH